jgi:predicted amidohydrolase YtcJ
VERRSRGGRVLGAAEALSPERALALFTTDPGAPGGSPRRVRVGAVADLCLLHEPWSVARCKLSKELVAQVLCGGERSSC